MAVLSAPTNTPTLDGTTAVCVSDDATGTVYLSVRTDRQWYSVANGDSQELADADKAVIIAGTTDANIVFADNQAASLDPEQIISGLAARLDPANPYYVGWVQQEPEADPGYLFTHEIPAGFTFTRNSIKPIDIADGSVYHVPANQAAFYNADWDGVNWSNDNDTSRGVQVQVEQTLFVTAPRDMTDAAWTHPDITVVRDQAGRDGSANTACLLTAGANDAAITQLVTMASDRACYSIDLKRSGGGSGTVALTMDGTNWTLVTVTSEWSRVWMKQDSGANPTIGVRLGTSGDAVIADYNSLNNLMNWPLSRNIATTVRDELYGDFATIGLDDTKVNGFSGMITYSIDCDYNYYHEYIRILEISDNSEQNSLVIWMMYGNSVEVRKKVSNTIVGDQIVDLTYQFSAADEMTLKFKQDATGVSIWDTNGTKTVMSNGGTWGENFAAAITKIYLGGRAPWGSAEGALVVKQCRIHDEALDDSIIQAW